MLTSPLLQTLALLLAMALPAALALRQHARHARLAPRRAPPTPRRAR